MADRSVSWTDAERVASLLKQVSSPKGSAGRGYAARTHNTNTAAAAPSGGNGRAATPLTTAPLTTAQPLAPAAPSVAPPGIAIVTVPKGSAPAAAGHALGSSPSASPSSGSSPAPAFGSASNAQSSAPSRTEPLPPAPLPARDFAPSKPNLPEPSAVPRLQQTSDNPSDRLDALVAWTLDHHRCNGAFVADDNGLTLAAHGISEAHVSLVGPLFSAMMGIRSIPGIDGTAGALWLGANMMSWVEARNERGGFCLGAVGPEPLSTQALEQLKEALELTIRTL